jgi:hypothetical protein
MAHADDDIAVIGAGMAGISCATALQQAGRQVAVFEKARGVGGRMATRRGEGVAFDHGAQYFTARSATFRAAVAGWEVDGVVAPWQGLVAAWNGERLTDTSASEARYVAVPGMSRLGRHLLGETPCHTGMRLSGMTRLGEGWQLAFEDGSVRTCRQLVLALPAPQASALLGVVPPFKAMADSVMLQPCWAVMAQFAHPLAVPFDGCFVNAGPLGWAARNNSKPERPRAEAWVLHATPAWSQVHLENDADIVVEQLLAAFADISGQAITPTEAAAHRWRYARSDSALQVGCAYDPSLRLGLAGDWLNGDRVEGAWDSGRQLAAQLLAAG